METFSPGSQTRPGAIFIGALIMLLAQLLFFLFGSFVGLIFLTDSGSESTQTIAVSTGVYLLIALLLSVFAGAYVAARLSGPQRRFVAGVHGVGAFALAVIFSVASIGIGGGSTLSPLLARAGLGAGSVVGADVMLEQVSKMRIVTDLSVLKGKAVTQIVIPQEGSASIGEEALKELRQKAGKAAKEADIEAPSAKEAASAAKLASAAAFLALLLGALVSYFAAVRGGRQR
ncbi:MAG: hypothetical protein A2X94_03260 [Bdellovibrionales bacterium GWB1_55_8]|nr:MAG: hypothetical protein A2X94_03260 [Bdellovibrionales bacterium GWB1_55_8]